MCTLREQERKLVYWDQLEQKKEQKWSKITTMLVKV